ncbi:TMV resistance protein N-like isoform X2 [Vigna unguiculata]|uniref:TMV resistance protein N-like isoform X2 n=1 Tax=Vigna unguiculata TaxID=3917 RepID=UPI001016B717|nr:TMV resistance protein N-like isoform X2 [Vigna unguiculata]
MMSDVASSSNSSKKYDVFLSFRGEDTRMNFTSHLHEVLKQKKVETYIDYRLEKGDEISPALIKAIEDSHVSIVIISENYAFSKWCLEELSKILECRKIQGQIVIPVFYNIDPSHVRKQTGSYEQAFVKHQEDFRCNKWRAALAEVANFSGWDSRNRIESELLMDIVGDILRKLTARYPTQLKGLVGIEENYEQIESLLRIGSREVRTLGIWGMGGIGKTTLATALYAKFSPEFEGGCFLTNVRENSSRQGGLEALRSKLFTELLENENHCFGSPLLVPQFVMSRLGHKKVFIVLDDVATSEQLECLIIDYGLLGPGSRIIVTTRDKQIFRPNDEIYEVKELSIYHSLELFSLTAFEEKIPKQGYEDLSRRAISYCKGIPLALKVLGASLCRRSKEAWVSELRKLKKISNMEIHNVLKLSYDGLDRSQKDILLDIACFLKGEHKDRVTNLLEACDFFAASGIEVLLDKALVTISYSNNIQMHDLIQEMGQEIVDQESIKDSGRRSRLWRPEEVHQVLKHNLGTEVVEAITLDTCDLNRDLNLSSNSFTKMVSMRFLKIHSSYYSSQFNVHLPSGLESLSDKLRYFRWDGFCHESLSSNFHAEYLVELDMRRSKLRKLWEGVQSLVNLEKIHLEASRDLVEIPDLSKAEKLKRIDLSDCESLRKLHPSISSLPKLAHLELSGCRKIENLNVHSKYLQRLNLEGCSSLKELSVTSHKMVFLDLSYTAICSLPSSIQYNTELARLFLKGCDNLSFVQSPPNIIGHLFSLLLLDLSGTNVESLPASIKNLSMMKLLVLDDCRTLVSLPELPRSLEMLTAYNCTSLETVFTQLLVSEHMLQSCKPYLSKQYYYPKQFEGGCAVFPGDHIMNDFGFHAEDSSITIPYLSLPELCGFICCFVLSEGSIEGHISCSIYQDSEQVGIDEGQLLHTALISDHVKDERVRIKECGVFPVYASESGLKLFGSDSTEFFELESITQSFDESQSRAIGVGVRCTNGENGLESFVEVSNKESQLREIGVGGSSNENENEWEHLLHVITSSVFF